MSVEKQIELTEKYKLDRCSCGRCCNAEIVDKLYKALKMYGEMDLKEYPDLGTRARRVIKEINEQSPTNSQ
jgi:hypothetical protein